ncbi:MAG: hypothetical protein OXC06_16990 [Acidimicrobiaceae bacterium]|nr:hypothetical protein [Acidimicrobiaceae bacterium]
MASWILISGGSVIDGTGAQPVGNCSVLVKDDEIVAVGVDVGDEEVPRGDPLTNGGSEQQPDRRDFASDGERELIDEIEELSATTRSE